MQQVPTRLGMRRRRSGGGRRRRARSLGGSHRRCRRSALPAPQLPLSAPHAKREGKPAPRAHSLEPPGTPYPRPLPSRRPAQKRGRAGPPPARRRRAFPRLAALVAPWQPFGERGGAVAPQCKNDHPSQMLHVRQNSWKQVGSLSRPSASRIYRRRCPGCPWFEEILLPQNAPSPRGSD